MRNSVRTSERPSRTDALARTKENTKRLPGRLVQSAPHIITETTTTPFRPSRANESTTKSSGKEFCPRFRPAFGDPEKCAQVAGNSRISNDTVQPILEIHHWARNPNRHRVAGSVSGIAERSRQRELERAGRHGDRRGRIQICRTLWLSACCADRHEDPDCRRYSDESCARNEHLHKADSPGTEKRTRPWPTRPSARQSET